MLVGAYQSAMLLAVIIVFYVLDFWLINRFDPLRAEGSSRSWSYTLMAMVAVIFLIAQPIVWPGLGLRIDAWWGLLVQLMGLPLIGGGLALHVWARTHLGQFYGEREEVQPGQYLIESGPYAYVRHPLYTTYYMLSIGAFLVNPALPTLLAVVYSLVDFTLAIQREEKLLLEELPGYADYMKRTSRFFPKLRK